MRKIIILFFSLFSIWHCSLKNYGSFFNGWRFCGVIITDSLVFDLSCFKVILGVTKTTIFIYFLNFWVLLKVFHIRFCKSCLFFHLLLTSSGRLYQTRLDWPKYCFFLVWHLRWTTIIKITGSYYPFIAKRIIPTQINIQHLYRILIPYIKPSLISRRTVTTICKALLFQYTFMLIWNLNVI